MMLLSHYSERLKVNLFYCPCRPDKYANVFAGLGDVERAFVHVDYECEHNIHEEHKPLYDRKA